MAYALDVFLPGVRYNLGLLHVWLVVWLRLQVVLLSGCAALVEALDYGLSLLLTFIELTGEAIHGILPVDL
jgi:hypothetical protein